LTAMLAVVCADNAAANRGHSSGRSSGHSSAKASAPAHAHATHPANAAHSHFAHSHVHAPLPRTRIVVAPLVIYRPAPIFYVPPVAYIPPPLYYVPPVYPSGAFYPAPVAGDPRYQPPTTEYVEQPPSVAQAPQYQYFCPDTRLYYPAASECASGWLKVVPDSGSIR